MKLGSFCLTFEYIPVPKGRGGRSLNCQCSPVDAEAIVEARAAGGVGAGTASPVTVET